MRFTFVILLFCGLSADAQMIIKAHPNYVPFASANLLLDQYSGAAAAYSLRKLRTAYTGSAIRVRRSNDNTEQDIGFTSSGDLDTGALKTFVAANSGFVTTWYDQSGNARNATQTTAANQPRVVNAGTVERVNTKPSIFLDGSNDFFAFTSTRTSANDVYYVINTTDNSFAIHTNDNSGLYGYLATQSSTSTTLYQNYGTPTLYVNNTLRTPTNRGNIYTYYNGITSLTSIINANLNNLAWQNTSRIGAVYLFAGRISEFVLFDVSNSSNRTGIQTNINSYYGIY
jgi:hypothetical protein